MRMAAQVIFASLIGAIAGFWVTANNGLEVAHGILLTAAERVVPYSTTVSDYLKPPALREAWSDLMKAEALEVSEADKENALATYKRAALRELRASMHNPASFSVVSVQRGPLSILCVTFRATNAFNALMLGRAFVSGIGVFPESASDPAFDRQWDKSCTKPVADTRAIEKTRHDIDVLRAERAYLARPQRVEEIARKVGLPPITPQQYKAPTKQ